MYNVNAPFDFQLYHTAEVDMEARGSSRARSLISPREMLIWWPETKRIMASYFESQQRTHRKKLFYLSRDFGGADIFNRTTS
jgi:hypothetical protein